MVLVGLGNIFDFISILNVIHHLAARYRYAAHHGNHWKIKCIFFLSQ